MKRWPAWPRPAPRRRQREPQSRATPSRENSAQPFWNRERFAHRTPDDLRVFAVGQCLRDCAPAKVREHVVLGHAVGVPRTELRVHPLPEHSQPHDATLPAPPPGAEPVSRAPPGEITQYILNGSAA
jgi:hypothetical protein